MIKKSTLGIFCLIFFSSHLCFANKLHIGNNDVGVYVYSTDPGISATIAETKVPSSEKISSDANTGGGNHGSQATWTSKSFEQGWAYAYSNGDGSSSSGNSNIEHIDNKDMVNSSSKTRTRNTGEQVSWEGGIGGGSYRGGNFGFSISTYGITIPKNPNSGGTLSGSATTSNTPNGVISKSNAQIRR